MWATLLKNNISRFKKNFLLIFVVLVSSFSIYLFNNYFNKKEIIVENNINKNLFKNKLLDEVIDDINIKFKSSKYDITEFKNSELDSIIYFYSQISNFEEAYILIEYKEFDVTKISFNFINAKKEDFDDISKIITLLIIASNTSIQSIEAEQIVINMLAKFKEEKDTVILVYDDLVYSININDNNNIEFSIK